MTKFQSTALVRKLTILLLALLLVLSLAACKAEVYTVEKDGVTYTVDPENSTIFDGKYTYKYAFDGNSADYDATINYPNGAFYWWESSSRGGQGGYSHGYDEALYAKGEVLTAILKAHAPKSTLDPLAQNRRFLLSLLLLVIGILFVAFPKAMARAKFYWWVKNAEPSDFAIAVYFFLGIFSIIVGLVSLFN